MTRFVCGLLMLLVPIARLSAAELLGWPSPSDEPRVELASTPSPKDQAARNRNAKEAAAPSAVAQAPVDLLTLLVVTTATLEELAESLREPGAEPAATRH